MAKRHVIRVRDHVVRVRGHFLFTREATRKTANLVYRENGKIAPFTDGSGGVLVYVEKSMK